MGRSLSSSKFSFSSCQKRTKNEKYSSSTSMRGEFFIFIEIFLFFLSEKKKKIFLYYFFEGGSLFSMILSSSSSCQKIRRKNILLLLREGVLYFYPSFLLFP